MPTSMRSLVLAAGFAGAFVTGTGAQDLSGPSSPLLQPEWTVEPARGGGTHVVGYLYNRNIKDAANVWLRVDRLGADGAVAGTYRRRVVGDVLSGNRSLFDVPVGEGGATYRVAVETVDWVKECR
jgi:hypothetical protein